MLDAAETQLEAVADIISAADEVAAALGDDLTRAVARDYGDIKEEYAGLAKRILGFDATGVHHEGCERHTAQFNERWCEFRGLAYNAERCYNTETELPALAQCVNDMIAGAATHWGHTEMQTLHAEVQRCSHHAARVLECLLGQRVRVWKSINECLPKEARQ